MFYRYEIVQRGNEDILYLYLNMKYEFSNELIRKDTKELSRRTKNFINSNNIKFNGSKVYLIVDDIIVKVVDIKDVISDNKYNDYYSPDNFMVNITLPDKSLSEITLREYLLNQMFIYHSYNLNDEVFRAICVLLNGYAYKMKRENSYIDYLETDKTDINNFEINEIISKYNKIIDSVNGMFLSYNHTYILPFIHYSSCGKTLSNPKYPYLSSVNCLWDYASDKYVKYTDYSYNYINEKLEVNIDPKSSVFISGSINNLKIHFNNVVFTSEELKNILNLNSNNIYIILYNDKIRIITFGCGNSYGLSLFSANELANNGHHYNQILGYFFPKTKLNRFINND